MPWFPVTSIDVKKAGTLVGTRGGINFIEGSNVTLTVADDASNDEVDVTIAASGGAGGGISGLAYVLKSPFHYSFNNHTVGANNAARFMRGLGAGSTVNTLVFSVSPSSGTLSVGVYDNDGGTGSAANPGTRKATSGSVACPSTGDASVALTASTTFDDGDWFALASSTTSAGFHGWDAVSTGTTSTPFSQLQLSAHPLPATAAASSGSRAFAMYGEP